jgi:hypothetical protein
MILFTLHAPYTFYIHTHGFSGFIFPKSVDLPMEVDMVIPTYLETLHGKSFVEVMPLGDVDMNGDFLFRFVGLF